MAYPKKKTPFDVAFGKFVRGEREAAAMTRLQLADKLDVSLCTIADLEQGNRIITLELIVKLKAALGFSGSVIGGLLNEYEQAYHWERRAKSVDIPVEKTKCN